MQKIELLKKRIESLDWAKNEMLRKYPDADVREIEAKIKKLSNELLPLLLNVPSITK